MPTPNQQRRRALELLESSIDGCTEAIMLAYGFKTELVAGGKKRLLKRGPDGRPICRFSIQPNSILP